MTESVEDWLTPTTGLVFDFEPYLYNQLGLFICENKKQKQEICKLYLKGQCRQGHKCPNKHVRSEKLTMCKHWLRGLCKKGEQCEFLHEFDLKKMPECWFYSNYGECSNPECMYLHIDPDSKLKECPWYNRGFCKHGPSCRQKHVRKMPCQSYLTGFCPLGSKCEMGHPKFDIPKFDLDEFRVLNLPSHYQQQPQPVGNGTETEQNGW